MTPNVLYHLFLTITDSHNSFFQAFSQPLPLLKSFKYERNQEELPLISLPHPNKMLLQARKNENLLKTLHGTLEYTSRGNTYYYSLGPYAREEASLSLINPTPSRGSAERNEGKMDGHG